MPINKGGDMNARGKLHIALLYMLIACFGLTSTVVAEDLPALPTAAQMDADPTVSAAIEQAWTDSQAGDKDNRHEEGGWIIQDTQTGALSVVRWPAGNRSSINPGDPPEIPCHRVVGEFHTHPNPPVDEDGNRWEQGPSQGDRNALLGTPGKIRNAAGTEHFGPETGGLPHTPLPEEQVDASITFVSWTIDGQQVPPGQYTVYPPTIIDCEYDVFVNGTECETVNVTASFKLPYHYGGPNEFKSWHVANAPGSISTIPPGTIWSQNASVNGVVKPVCYSFDVLNCQNVTLDAHITIELHKGTNYRVKINWLGYKGSGPDDVLFDNLIEWAGCWGNSDMVTSGCVDVPGDVNPANDCSGDSPILYITHDYLC